ncbi:MAG: hypothetical protein ABSD03_11025 [Vulcanimicrobiaceae bacterium]
MAFRQAGEPAGRPLCYPGLNGTQTFTPPSGTIIQIFAANKSSSTVATLTVSDSVGQIGSLVVPVNDTRDLFGDPGVTVTQGSVVTLVTAEALDITVVIE